MLWKTLKSHLTSPPILLKLEDEEELYIYLVVFAHAVSLLLVRIAKGTQKSVYYVSKAFEDAKTRYSDIEKLTLALFISSKKLCLYFESYYSGDNILPITSNFT